MPHQVGDYRRTIREWRERDPHATAAEMAQTLGISRQRVCQLLTALGLPTRTRRGGGSALIEMVEFQQRLNAETIRSQQQEIRELRAELAREKKGAANGRG